GMDQFVRDARIAMIYEGTNGVQAMDLAGRKLALNGGRAVQALFALIDAECAEDSADETVKLVAERLSKATGEMKAATMWFMQNAMANPNNLGAGAYAYMTLTGIVSLGLMWLRMAKVAAAAIGNGADDKAFYEAKLACARHWATRYTTEAGALRREVEAGCETIMALSPEQLAIA
ncbi:MAG: acyl-CoA dehydrogenase, partial [Novosphingobium sp. 35-62-5]